MWHAGSKREMVNLIPPKRLVLIEWHDSRRGEGWTRLEDLKTEHRFSTCLSVGWILFEDSDAITLAGHIGNNPEQCCGDMTIPVCSIVYIRNISLPESD